MKEFIEAIKAWPIIVQGALGSALFWLVLVVGQRFVAAVSNWHSTFSKNTRISYLVSARVKYQGSSSTTELGRIEGFSGLTFRALRPILRALMWLTQGLMLDAVFSPAGLIGYLICLYYLV